MLFTERTKIKKINLNNVTNTGANEDIKFKFKGLQTLMIENSDKKMKCIISEVNSNNFETIEAIYIYMSLTLNFFEEKYTLNIDRCLNLNALNLIRCDLTELTNLEYLNLSRNKITSISE